jgi:protein-S-isoprenylcysteine O-methyltransferase Ste14
MNRIQTDPITHEQTGGVRSRWMLVPPPLLYGLSFAGSLGLQRLLPFPLGGPALRHELAIAGIAICVAAAALIISAPLIFLMARTTLIPQGEASSMIVGGPFRVSRNPMYLGLTLAYLGATLLTNTGWPLLVLAFPLWVIATRTIPFEERAMSRLFGEDYRSYQRRVRRWI